MPYTIVFPRDEINPHRVDAAFQNEANAAITAGLDIVLIDWHAAQTGNTQNVCKAKNHPTQAIYRGWMLHSAGYTCLYQALAARSISLINDPIAYSVAHYLPNALPFLRNTADTVVIPSRECSEETILTALLQFGHKACIVKDYVKSQKGYWHDACYIPNAADVAHARSVIRRFLELQGSSLEGGILLREFLPLRMQTNQRPEEYRAFILHKKVVLLTPHWTENSERYEHPSPQCVLDLAGNLPSSFYTADLAYRTDQNAWCLIEVGDAQVSGIDQTKNISPFYQTLAQRNRP